MRVASTTKINHIISNNLDSYLKIGDIIKGRIIDKDGNLVSIRLTSQYVIDALIESDIDIQKGSSIEIMITNITERKIYAKILEQNLHKETYDNIESILNNLGIAKTEENLEILEAFMKYNQPLNKDTIEYTKYLLRIIESFNKENVEKVLKLLFCQKDIMNTPLHKLNTILDSTDIDIENIKDLFLKGLNKTEDFNLSMENFSQNIIKLCGFNNDVSEKLKQLANEAGIAMDTIKDTDLETIMFIMSKNIEVNLRNILIYKLINEKGSILNNSIKDLTQCLKLKKDVQNLIANIEECYLKPEDLSEENIKNKTSRLIKILSEIENNLVKNNDLDFNTRYSISNVKETINFLNSLNRHFNYIYIPMAFNNNKGDVEIFIFEKKRRNKKVDASNANILISLNMPSIGYIESLIEVRNNRLNIVFKSEDKSVAKMMEAYSSRLKEMLFTKGYENVAISSVQKTDKRSDFSNVNKIINPEVINDYSRIDVRI